MEYSGKFEYLNTFFVFIYYKQKHFNPDFNYIYIIHGFILLCFIISPVTQVANDAPCYMCLLYKLKHIYVCFRIPDTMLTYVKINVAPLGLNFFLSICSFKFQPH